MSKFTDMPMTLLRRLRQARLRRQSAHFAAAQCSTPLHEDDPLAGGEIEHWAEILTPTMVADPTARAILCAAVRRHSGASFVDGLFSETVREFEHV